MGTTAGRDLGDRWEVPLLPAPQLFLSVYVGRLQQGRRKLNIGSDVAELKKHIDHEDSTLSLNKVYLSCTHKLVIASVSELSRRIITPPCR